MRSIRETEPIKLKIIVTMQVDVSSVLRHCCVIKTVQWYTASSVLTTGSPISHSHSITTVLWTEPWRDMERNLGMKS